MQLATAHDNIEAHLLAGRLTERGIETQRVTDHGAPGAWLYGGSNPWAPVRVLVRRWQLDEARLVLAEVSYAAPTAERSPFPGRAPRSLPLLWWTTALALGVALSLIALVEAARATTPYPPASCDEASAARPSCGPAEPAPRPWL